MVAQSIRQFFYVFYLYILNISMVELFIGIAFRGLKNMEIYPVVSSTAARSAVRLVSSIATKETLQMLCLQVISEHPQLRSQFRAIPAFTRIYDQKYFWINTNSE